ncbi:MAG TPA: fluoride efflux transporter CrcB, partial [Hyphomonadaceae bacterium]|nr:fluoride efflux transporter CrcB [Hyphomonadaceae bacterium]
GGAVGASIRYLLSGVMLRQFGDAWPYGTFSINVLGSFLIGLLGGWLAFRGEAGLQLRLLLVTGVLGGFTTFSAYSIETANLIEKKAYFEAATYSLGSVAVGLVAVFAGLWIARKVFA